MVNTKQSRLNLENISVKKLGAYDKATYENEIATQVSEFLTNESTFKTIPDSLIKWYVSIEMKHY